MPGRACGCVTPCAIGGGGGSSLAVLRAHSLGFTLAQTKRWGVTPANASTFISERDYEYLAPFNGIYDKWLTDRVSLSLVLGEDAHLLETIHFHIMLRDGAPLFIPMSDVACTWGGDFAALISLLSSRPSGLALVTTSWSRARTWRVRYAHGMVCVNGERMGVRDFSRMLSRLVRSYSLALVERVARDDFVHRVYPEMTGSVRVLLCSFGGRLRVTDAYLRLKDKQTEKGKKASVDSGTRFYACPIDVRTGAFEGARAIYPGGRWEDLPSHPATGRRFSGAVPGWAGVVQELERAFSRLALIEFVELTVRMVPGAFKVVRAEAHPAYSRAWRLSAEASSALGERSAAKRAAEKRSLARAAYIAFRRARKRFAEFAYPPHMVFYQSLRWPHDVLVDLFSANGVPLSRKLWAYRHGFLSYRVDLYGLSEATWRSCISDFEYRWLRHINSKYRKLLEDKVSLKYLAAGYGECFPAYYLYFDSRFGTTRALRLMDCPREVAASVDGVLMLAREKGALALKPEEGSHGEGFYRLTYHGGRYRLNGDICSPGDVRAVLERRGCCYLVSEYIVMHDELRALYPKAVNTVRMTVVKPDGVHPVLGNAYLRIGSRKTGAVDNVVAGGIVAEVDVETGAFGDAKALVRNRVVSVAEHPDTHVALSGMLPNWEVARASVLDIAASLRQVEYLGFDVAITQKGVCIVEINRFPDFPRIARLTDTTMGYLLERLESKKSKCLKGDAGHAGIVRLPER